jgi:hypothetical protein
MDGVMAVQPTMSGAIGGDGGADLLLGQIVGHGVDEAHLRVARALERTGEIGHPRRRPIAGDLGAARVVVWVDEENAHASSPRPVVSVNED